MMTDDPYKIVAFDGVCNLCNHTVNWIIDYDPKKKFKFIALQQINQNEFKGLDPSIINLLKTATKSDSNGIFQSVYYIDQGQFYEKSTAVLRICRELTGLWPLLYVYIIIPKRLRDIVYDFIAQNRYAWFGKSDQCRMPSTELHDRFL